MKKSFFFAIILFTIILPHPRDQVKLTTERGTIIVDLKNPEGDAESFNKHFDDLQSWYDYGTVSIQKDPTVEKYIFTITPVGVFGDSTPVRDVSLQSTDTSDVSHILKNYIDMDTGYLTLEDVEPAKGKSKFEYKLLKGDKFTYKITSIIDFSLDAKTEQVVDTKMHLKYVHLVDFEVKNVDITKIAEVKVTIRSINIKSKINGEISEYRTGDKLDSAKEVDYRSEKALTSHPFFVRIDKNGGIREIFGINSIVDAITIQRDGEMDSDHKNITADLIKSRLEDIIRQVFVSFSPGSLKANETFKDKRPEKNIIGGYNLNTTILYTLREKGKYKGSNISVIEVGYDFSCDLFPQLKEQGVKFDRTKFTYDGRIFYNDDLGKLQKLKTDVTSEVALSGRIHNGKGGVMDYTHIQKTRSLTVSEIIK
ncbi:MAG: hypothetical protein J0L60_05370 [Ignavibacteria bacterium]|nr:hypothetical protein [Ignavibacteria bacterium]